MAVRFQFTPLREGRRLIMRATSFANLFQFTPLREGRRARDAGTKRGTSNFNSRPSARGDSARQSWRCSTAYFNSRPSARGDPSSSAQDAPEYVFQFTPLREGRLACCECCSVLRHFNSRPSARGDVLRRRSLYHQGISIHAPPRGATQGILTSIPA